MGAQKGERRGWFSDINEDEGVNEYVWQPCLETGNGHIPCFDVWFKSQADCDRWIAENVLGVGMFDEAGAPRER